MAALSPFIEEERKKATVLAGVTGRPARLYLDE
jgi:hypothetical protein